jgi:phosphoglycolate phosphatase/pyrophosphatase PpaX
MKYKCLILDHDDTVVNSSASIHFPSFIEYLKLYFPEKAGDYDVNSYFIKNFDPGIVSLLMDEVGLTEEQMEEEERFWANYVENHIPTAYAGMGDIIAEFRARGGIVCVDSHSLTRYIKRDFAANGLPMPDVIYGWDIPKDMRKPSPKTVLEIMEKYKLSPREVIVVDDLKPGYDMARGAGVDFAAAGWAYDVPEIEEFMRKNCDYYLKTVDALAALLFD